MGYKPGFMSADIPQDENRGDFKPLPDGEYTIIVDKMDIHPTSTGGVGLKTTYQVVDGLYKSRLIFDFINVENKNPTAEAIGRRRVAEISYAVGFADVADDTDLLLHKPFKVAVGSKQETYQGQTQTKNIIKKVFFAKPGKSEPVPVAVPAVAAAMGGGEVVEPDDSLPF